MEDTLEFKVFFKPQSVVTVKLGTRTNIFSIYFMLFGDWRSSDKIQCSILVMCLTIMSFFSFFIRYILRENPPSWRTA